jgi:hypothetical protein
MNQTDDNKAAVGGSSPLICSPAFGSPPLDSFWESCGERFTELLTVGGYRPSSYGCIDGGGIYGRTGLDQNEFYESIRLIAYVDGMLAILGPDADEWLRVRVLEERDKHRDPQENTQAMASAGLPSAVCFLPNDPITPNTEPS